MRKQISNSALKIVENEFKTHIQKILEKKGLGTFSSIHEISGALTEEYDEFKDSVHTRKQMKLELLDIATVCFFAIACINSNTLDY